MSLIEKVRATMKSTDIEGRFELYFTRLPGYLWAVFFKKLHVHPIAVTLVSIVLGALAGWCFYYDNIWWTLLGILMLLWANWYDCADGQLARMTDQRTLIGRILDGFAGDVWFFAIYFFICLRLTPEWGIWIWLLCAWSGFRCHGRQCAVADYYRNIHLWVQFGSARAELDDYQSVRADFTSKKWLWKNGEWFEKLYLFFYGVYTDGQEKQTPAFQKLRAAMKEKGMKELPEDLRLNFRQESRKLMFPCQVMTFDERAGVLFVSMLVGLPWLYPVVECTLIEALRYWTIRKHERLCLETLEKL